MLVRIEATLGEMPSIMVKLLHWGFTFKVIPQFNHPTGDIDSISDVSIIEIKSDIYSEFELKIRIKQCLCDQVPNWVKFIKDRKPEFVIK